MSSSRSWPPPVPANPIGECGPLCGRSSSRFSFSVEIDAELLSTIPMRQIYRLVDELSIG